ncbi:uncharacterized protein isoform X2 [Rhodnius prolixus]|uniref:uncharacterized protein isoform X2 n=1 Tax=Rhodnius prolixus TaxID=13249 RepID=UPI003D18F20F
MLNDTGLWRLSILSRMEAKEFVFKSSQRFALTSFNYQFIKQWSSYYLSLTELVENAIVAGVSNTEITLENEGFEKIDAKNNGKGIRRPHLSYMYQCRYT